MGFYMFMNSNICYNGQANELKNKQINKQANELKISRKQADKYGKI